MDTVKITASEAATLLGTDPSSVRRFAKKGLIAHTKFGTQYAFTRQEIGRFKKIYKRFKRF